MTHSECQENGPVKVCALNRKGSYPRLVIYYNGYLKQYHHGNIQTWVKFNSKSNYFKLDDNYHEDKITIGKPQEEIFCKYPVIGETYNGGYLPICPDMEPQEEYGTKWYVKEPKTKDLDLLFYAKNEYGMPNACDIELAFVGGGKDLDSLNEYNYKFHIE